MDTKRYCVRVIIGIIAYYGVSVKGDHDRHRDVCKEDDDTPGMYSYCEEGYYCCENNTRCCYDGLSVPVVVGIVMASLFLIGVCLLCSVLLTKKKKRPNRIVAPINNPVSTVNQQHIYIGSHPNGRGQSQNFISPPYPYGQPPPPYGQPFQQGQPIPYSQVVPPVFLSSAAPPQPPPYCRDDQAAPPAYKLEP